MSLTLAFWCCRNEVAGCKKWGSDSPFCTLHLTGHLVKTVGRPLVRVRLPSGVLSVLCSFWYHTYSLISYFRRPSQGSSQDLTSGMLPTGWQALFSGTGGLLLENKNIKYTKLLTVSNKLVHVISIVKPTRCTNVSYLFYFGMTLYMFRTVFLSIIRSSRLYIQQQAFVRQILLSACWRVQQYLFDKCMLLYVQSRTPDDGRKDRNM
jgi:hypothetical protein